MKNDTRFLITNDVTLRLRVLLIINNMKYTVSFVITNNIMYNSSNKRRYNCIYFAPFIHGKYVFRNRSIRVHTETTPIYRVTIQR